MARFKVDVKDGTSYKTTIRGMTLKEMKSWQRAFNRNYANGRKVSKRRGVARITLVRSQGRSR